MILDDNTQGILLLSAYFSRHNKGNPTPLTPTEYGRFASWLHEHQLEPRDLISDFDATVSGWHDPKGKITIDRLQYLLGRGLGLSLAVEKWNSTGIWIMTRADPDYPRALKQSLKQNAPAVLFGVGNRKLVGAGGLAIVGSRNVDSVDTYYTKAVAQQAANEGLNIVSGGARGVDEVAMLSALEVEGTATGVLANDLLKAALSSKWRPYLLRKDLCLISTYYPEVPFNAGNAMGRNKYVYCIANYVLVVRSEEGSGGTWAGAKEGLKKGYAPVFVKTDSDADGNLALIRMGASPLRVPESVGDSEGDWLTAQLDGTRLNGPAENVSELEREDLVSSTIHLVDNYANFVTAIVKSLKTEGEISLKTLNTRHPNVAKKQVREWAEQAVSEHIIDRPSRRLLYGLPDQQKTLFE